MFIYVALFLLTCCSIVAGLVQWTGGSGSWHIDDHWSTGMVPVETDVVLLNVSSNQIITMYSNVTIAELIIAGGSLEIGGNSTLLVSDSFEFQKGTIKAQTIGLGIHDAECLLALQSIQ